MKVLGGIEIWLFLSLVFAIRPSLGAPEAQSLARRALPDAIKDFRFNAPPARNLDNALSEEELLLSPIVLVVTVDGQVHALLRESGKWLWTLHDDGGMDDLGGMRENSSRIINLPLVKAIGKRITENTTNSLASGSAAPLDEQEVYIIEPYSGGDIYLYSRNDAENTLEKLPLSMQELVSLSPFTFPSDTSRLFVGKKETNLVGIDLKTGRLVGVFGSERGWCEWNPSVGVKNQQNPACDEEISRRPEDLLYMARTEYHISIYSKTSSSLLQTLSYTTYSPSTLGLAEQQWKTTSDGRFLQPMHDGNLLCFSSEEPGLQWATHFDHPVVSIFDVGIPQTGESPNQEIRQPLMFKQSTSQYSQLSKHVFGSLEARPDSAFIGQIDNNLFAMSRDNFPLVALLSQEEDDLTPEDENNNTENEEKRKKCTLSDCVLGHHQIRKSSVPTYIDTIEPPEKLLGIDAAPVQPNPSPSTPYAPGKSSELASGKPTKALSSTYSYFIGSLLLLFLGYLSLRKYLPDSRKITQNRISSFNELPLPPKPSPVNHSRDVSLVSATTTIPIEEKELPPLPPEALENPEGPKVKFANIDSDGEAPEAGQDTPKKKPRRRRTRKKKKGVEEDGDGEEASEDAPTSKLVIFDDMGASEKDLRELSLENVGVNVEDGQVELFSGVTGPVPLGGLNISQEVIGLGSHGTVVLRGEFQGRAVAVKRLLKDYVTIAMHEVTLLQESDDHPHVVRYFCKEQRDNYLYIALELCPASLYTIIESPDTVPELAREFEPRRALRQITMGLRHLHQLKIVHRDIKPQNILVSLNKKGGLRMLISDFGLCKKLESDESSFAQTANNPAGSFGYRAPEVLKGQVDPNASAVGFASPPGSSGADTVANPQKIIPMMGPLGNLDLNAPPTRLTRSVDIFSLGCIFFYVMTKGDHPFGNRYEREVNILRGEMHLDQLDVFAGESVEIKDLVSRMCALERRDRPSADAVLLHPFFWNAQQRLLFICDASDRFEVMERDPPDPILALLEQAACEIVGDDWQKAMDKNLLDNLGKYRKYSGNSVRDLLRVLRNKKNHYQDLPQSLKDAFGGLPAGFLNYFTERFPRLLLHIYQVVATTPLGEDPMFSNLFQLPEDEH